MVKRTVKVAQLFSWSRNFDVDRDENVLMIIAHVGDREYHVAPDAATIDRLKHVDSRVRAILKEDIIVEGDILEVWEKQMVEEPGRTVEKYVRIQ